MAKYDLERLLQDIESILKSNLNSKIAEINSEKNDNITLDTIDSNAYALQGMNESVMAYDPFIFYGVESIECASNGAYTSITPSIQVVILLSDVGQDENISKRMFRYQRAISEVIEEAFTENQCASILEIQSLVPVELSQLNSSNRFRAIGVTIKASIA